MEKLTAKEHSLLTESIIKSLTQNRISTLMDFLQEDAIKLSTLTNLDVSEIFEIRLHILNKYSGLLVNGVNLNVNSITYKEYVVTGIDKIDTILPGGIPVGFITELCGLAGSGKTQLCIQIAINSVRHSNNAILYIDTKGDFSAMRIQQILEARGFSYMDIATIMLKIKIVNIWHIEDLIRLFEELKAGIIVFQNLSLILIDSLPCLIFQHFGDDNIIGLKYLNIFVNYARYISKQFKLGILCVNIQTRWIDQDHLDPEDDQLPTFTTKEALYVEKVNRCLGKYWHQIPTIVMFLEKYQDLIENDKYFIKLTVTSYNDPQIKRTCILENTFQGIR